MELIPLIISIAYPHLHFLNELISVSGLKDHCQIIVDINEYCLK